MSSRARARRCCAAIAQWPQGHLAHTMTVDGYDAPIELNGDAHDLRRRASTSTSPARRPCVSNGINVPKCYTDAYTSFGVRCIIGAARSEQRGLARDRARERARRLHRQCAASARRSRRARPSARCCPTWCSAACTRRGRTACRPKARRRCGTCGCAAARRSKASIPSNCKGDTPLQRGRLQDRRHRRAARQGRLVGHCVSERRPQRRRSRSWRRSSPVVFWKKEYRPDSGGAGEHRGGLGQIMEIANGEDAPMIISATFDRIVHPARGSAGGKSGGAGRLSLKSGTQMRGFGRQVIPAGDRVVRRDTRRRRHRQSAKAAAGKNSARCRIRTGVGARREIGLWIRSPTK